VNKKEEKSFVN